MNQNKGTDLFPHQQAVVAHMMRKTRPWDEKHFLVCPNYVVSRTDGQTHWISEHQLMRLYGVQRRECVIACCPTHHKEEEGLLHLEPSYEGDYSLPDVTSDPCGPYQSDDQLVQFALMRIIKSFVEIFPCK